jgi:hypothetical protein
LKIQDKSGCVVVFLAILALLLQAGYYLGGFAYTHPEYFFVIVGVIGSATLYSILAHPSRKFLVCFMILCTATFMNMTYVYYSQGFSYIPPLDAIYHWKTAEAITTSSRIAVNNATTIELDYSTYPGFHLFLSLTSMVTGIDSIIFVKLSPLIYSLLPLLVYIIAKRVFPSETVAWIAAYITIFLPKWYAFPSYDRSVIIYFLMLFFFLVELTIVRKRAHFVMALVSIFALSITHHVMTYITLIFLLFAILFSLIVKELNSSRLPIFRNAGSTTLSVRLLLSLLVCGIVFPVYSSATSFEFHLTSFLKYLSPGYVPEAFSTTLLGFYSRTEQEFILITIGLAGLVGIYGLIRYLRKDRWNATAVAFTVFFGSVFAISLPFMNVNPTINNYVTGRMVFITFIALAPFIGYALTKLPRLSGRRRIASFIAIVLMLCLTITSVDLIPRGYIYFSQEQATNQLWEVRNNSNSLWSSLIWVRQNTITSNWSAVGDVPLVSIGYGMLNLNMQYYWPLFQELGNGSEHLHQLDKIDARYVYVDSLLTRYREQPNFKRFIGPISASNLTMVTEETWASTIYDNRIISIIYINR